MDIFILESSQHSNQKVEIFFPQADLLAMANEPYNPIEVGKRITLIREAHGMRQVDFARHIGVTAKELHAWETGFRRPGLGKATAILMRYPVSADWLFYGDASRMPWPLAQRLFGRDPAPE